MPDEDETPPWLTENIAQLDRVRISRPLPAQELRRRGTQRRQRRTRSAVIAATAVTAVTILGAAAYWNPVSSDRSAEGPARHGEASRTSAAQDTLRAYYAALPDALATRDSTPKLWKLMNTHFTDTALKREAVLESNAAHGTDGLAATCGPVDATTTFTVAVPHSTGTDTARTRVTTNSTPGSIQVDIDLRTLKISNWSCPHGS
ncbi:hypothetical protein ACWD4T_16460 [Streptomyces umbrinus]